MSEPDGGSAGPVTFMFTDIEGSTQLVRALREEYPRVLAEHRELVRAAVAAHAGREVDTQGDSFFVAFGVARQALLCALAIQRALTDHAWPGGTPVRVRIGVHTGQATLAGGGYTGLAVHRASRICAAAHGGQVLMSQATAALAEDEEDDLGFALTDAGEYRLKDFDRPVRLFELSALDMTGAPQAGPVQLLSDKPAQRATADGGLHGFAAPLTTFIGRAGQVNEVAALLAERRLVTVTGMGGAGKTRLAGEVARQVAGRFADGVWLAELASVQDPGQVASVVAAALGIREQPGLTAVAAMAQVLVRQQLLLVLDNCEHVIDAAAELSAALLAAADDVRILATSREPLAVAGEVRYRLAPLTTLNSGADGSDAEAVALFADRARRADPRFTLDERTRPEVERLVARLDGMPLAIELAAARTEALGVSQLLDRIDDRFALLAGTDRLAPSRHRSLAATVEWSYRLLGEHERRVFRCVSVFPGPFTLAAAEAVAGTDAGPAVLHLVDCSLLVRPQPGPDGRDRYGMLETLRSYGARLLAEAGEEEAAAAALARFALGVAGRAADGLATGSRELAALHELDAEDATLRQALGWATGHDPAVELRLAVALAPWWLIRGRASGEYQLLRAAAETARPGEPIWCEAQFWLGQTAIVSFDLRCALDHFTAIRDAIADQGPSELLADALGGRSMTLANLTRLPEALDEGRRSLALADELGYPEGQAHALLSLTITSWYRGNAEETVGLAREAARARGDIRGWISRACRYVLVWTLSIAEDETAQDECRAALEATTAAGDVWNRARLLTLMGYLDVHAGRGDDAAAWLHETLQLIVRTGDWSELGNALDTCCELCVLTGRTAEALTLWASLGPYLPEEWAGEPRFRRLLKAQQAVRESLPTEQVAAAEARGAAMSWATAAEYALLLTAPDPGHAAAHVGLDMLGDSDRELLTLVARGYTDAQIASELRLDAGDVGSRLAAVRDKTGRQRRAELTQLALAAGLV